MSDSPTPPYRLVERRAHPRDIIEPDPFDDTDEYVEYAHHVHALAVAAGRA